MLKSQKSLPQNNSETVTNKEENIDCTREIYISRKKTASYYWSKIINK